MRTGLLRLPWAVVLERMGLPADTVLVRVEGSSGDDGILCLVEHPKLLDLQRGERPPMVNARLAPPGNSF